MNMVLTKKQKERLEWLAQQKSASLYVEESLSGNSRTLRWRREFVSNGPWGARLRTESGMVLSVKIDYVRGGEYGPNWIEDPIAVSAFNEKLTMAREYFSLVRNPPLKRVGLDR